MYVVVLCIEVLKRMYILDGGSGMYFVQGASDELRGHPITHSPDHTQLDLCMCYFCFSVQPLRSTPI